MKCFLVLFLYAIGVSRSEDAPDKSNLLSISVRNITGGNEHVEKIDVSWTLSKTREILHMSSEDYFYKSYPNDEQTGHVGSIVQVAVEVEGNVTVGDIVFKNRIFVGCLECNIIQNIENTSATPDSTHENSTTNSTEDSEVYFEIDHKNGTSFLKGLKVNSDGQFVMTNYRVADIKGHITVNFLYRSEFKTATSSDLKEFKIMSYGISDKSLRYGDILSYSPEPQQNYNWKKAQPIYRPPPPPQTIRKYVVEKEEIKISPSDITINEAFYNEIQNSMLTSQLKLTSAEQLLEVLQKYGWFIPLHFTTGASFNETETKKICNSPQAGNNNPNGTNSNTSSSQQQMGAVHGTASRLQQHTQHEANPPPLPTSEPDNAACITALNQTVSNSAKLKIVEYKRLLPTLMLLHNYNNWSLSQSLKLLSEFRVELQPKEAHIDIQKYTMALQLLLY